MTIAKNDELQVADSQYKEAFATMSAIDAELRGTNIRMIANPTPEQMEHYQEIIKTGENLLEEIPQDIKELSGRDIQLANWFKNFREVLRVQSITAGYVWKAMRKKSCQEEPA